MSVPLPSPSIVPTPKQGGQSRPTPITVTVTPNSNSPSTGSGDNWRERTTATNTGSIPKSSITSSISNTGSRGPIGGPNGGGRSGPERTVGGFEKREVRSGSGSGSGNMVGSPSASGAGGLNKEREREREGDRNGYKDKDQDKDKDKDKDGDGKAAALSHVPCRFFKAGACTAGASCQFSHAAPEPGKKEVCQWYLKGNCKFGHKCALAHVRPGEPLSMDRKNKREAQKELRERSDVPSPRIKKDHEDHAATSPVPIQSTITASSQTQSHSPSLTGITSQANVPTVVESVSSSSPLRVPVSSSPMREPYGPPSAVGSPSTGFGVPRPSLIAFASSPSRPSPLSSSFSGKPSVPGPLTLKSSATTSLHSQLRLPVTAAATGTVFSSSFSHSHSALSISRNERPMSASYVDPIRNIWARHETTGGAGEEPLSPARRPVVGSHQLRSAGVGIHQIDDGGGDDDEHGEDFLPSSLNELLTPRERARRLSRRDSQDSYTGSPRSGWMGAHGGGATTSNNLAYLPSPWGGNERLAQSAGAALGPGGFLQSLWSPDGEDVRKASISNQSGGLDFDFNPTPVSPVVPNSSRQSLLTQQRTPISQSGSQLPNPAGLGHVAGNGARTGSGSEPYILRDGAGVMVNDAASPTAARVLKEHLPGQSLPQGLAAGLSRLHLRGPRVVSGLSSTLGANSNGIDGENDSSSHKNGGGRKEEVDDDEVDLFTMDG